MLKSVMALYEATHSHQLQAERAKRWLPLSSYAAWWLDIPPKPLGYLATVALEPLT